MLSTLYQSLESDLAKAGYLTTYATVKRAFDLAVERHAGQFYNDTRPYYFHLLDVLYTVVNYFGFNENLMVSALLHDILEDTKTTRGELEELFGFRVAELVWLVTDEPGQTRKERKARTYPKIQSDFDAVALKLADRIANVKAGPLRREMYRKEHDDFIKGIMKNHHDSFQQIRADLVQAYKL